MGLVIILLFGCLEGNKFLLVDADVNGTDINVHYIDANRLCVGSGSLCIDYNGTDGLIG